MKNVFFLRQPYRAKNKRLDQVVGNRFLIHAVCGTKQRWIKLLSRGTDGSITAHREDAYDCMELWSVSISSYHKTIIFFPSCNFPLIFSI